MEEAWRWGLVRVLVMRRRIGWGNGQVRGGMAWVGDWRYKYNREGKEVYGIAWLAS